MISSSTQEYHQETGVTAGVGLGVSNMSGNLSMMDQQSMMMNHNHNTILPYDDGSGGPGPPMYEANGMMNGMVDGVTDYSYMNGGGVMYDGMPQDASMMSSDGYATMMDGTMVSTPPHHYSSPSRRRLPMMASGTGSTTTSMPYNDPMMMKTRRLPYLPSSMMPMTSTASSSNFTTNNQYQGSGDGIIGNGLVDYTGGGLYNDDGASNATMMIALNGSQGDPVSSSLSSWYQNSQQQQLNHGYYSGDDSHNQISQQGHHQQNFLGNTTNGSWSMMAPPPQATNMITADSSAYPNDTASMLTDYQTIPNFYNSDNMIIPSSSSSLTTTQQTGNNFIVSGSWSDGTTPASASVNQMSTMMLSQHQTNNHLMGNVNVGNIGNVSNATSSNQQQPRSLRQQLMMSEEEEDIIIDEGLGFDLPTDVDEEYEYDEEVSPSFYHDNNKTPTNEVKGMTMIDGHRHPFRYRDNNKYSYYDDQIVPSHTKRHPVRRRSSDDLDIRDSKWIFDMDKGWIPNPAASRVIGPGGRRKPIITATIKKDSSKDSKDNDLLLADLPPEKGLGAKITAVLGGDVVTIIGSQTGNEPLDDQAPPPPPAPDDVAIKRPEDLFTNKNKRPVSGLKRSSPVSPTKKPVVRVRQASPTDLTLDVSGKGQLTGGQLTSPLISPSKKELWKNSTKTESMLWSTVDEDVYPIEGSMIDTIAPSGATLSTSLTTGTTTTTTVGYLRSPTTSSEIPVSQRNQTLFQLHQTCQATMSSPTPPLIRPPVTSTAPSQKPQLPFDTMNNNAMMNGSNNFMNNNLYIDGTGQVFPTMDMTQQNNLLFQQQQNQFLQNQQQFPQPTTSTMTTMSSTMNNNIIQQQQAQRHKLPPLPGQVPPGVSVANERRKSIQLQQQMQQQQGQMINGDILAASLADGMIAARRASIMKDQQQQFLPTSQPQQQGRRGSFALTVADEQQTVGGSRRGSMMSNHSITPPALMVSGPQENYEGRRASILSQSQQPAGVLKTQESSLMPTTTTAHKTVTFSDQLLQEHTFPPSNASSPFPPEHGGGVTMMNGQVMGDTSSVTPVTSMSGDLMIAVPEVKRSPSMERQNFQRQQLGQQIRTTGLQDFEPPPEEREGMSLPRLRWMAAFNKIISEIDTTELVSRMIFYRARFFFFSVLSLFRLYAVCPRVPFVHYFFHVAFSFLVRTFSKISTAAIRIKMSMIEETDFQVNDGQVNIHLSASSRRWCVANCSTYPITRSLCKRADSLLSDLLLLFLSHQGDETYLGEWWSERGGNPTHTGLKLF